MIDVSTLGLSRDYNLIKAGNYQDSIDDVLDELVVDELFVPLQALRSERRIKVDNNVLNFFIFVSFTSSIYK